MDATSISVALEVSEGAWKESKPPTSKKMRKVGMGKNLGGKMEFQFLTLHETFKHAV